MPLGHVLETRMPLALYLALSRNNCSQVGSGKSICQPGPNLCPQWDIGAWAPSCMLRHKPLPPPSLAGSALLSYPLLALLKGNNNLVFPKNNNDGNNLGGWGAKRIHWMEQKLILL